VVARITTGWRSLKRHHRAIFEGLKDHAIGTLDLAVALRVGDQGVVDVDGVVLAEIPEGRTSESCT
jgi:hypothetical protein